MYNGLFIPLYQQRWFRLQLVRNLCYKRRALRLSSPCGIGLSALRILEVVALAFLRVCKPAANALVFEDQRTILMEVNDPAKGAEVDNVGANAELCHVEAFLPLSLGGGYFLSVS